MVHDDAWNMVKDETGEINNRNSSSKKSLPKALHYSDMFIRNGFLERLQPGTNVFCSVINLELNITTSFQKVASKMQQYVDFEVLLSLASGHTNSQKLNY